MARIAVVDGDCILATYEIALKGSMSVPTDLFAQARNQALVDGLISDLTRALTFHVVPKDPIENLEA